jgi:hypothetical protein
MPLIMPPPVDAVPAIIQVAAHKPAAQTPTRPADTPTPPLADSQAPGVVGQTPVTLPPASSS